MRTMLSDYPKVSVSVCEQKEHVNSTGPQFKFHSSEVTLNYDYTCSFKCGEPLGHQVHGLLPCAGKPRNGLFLLPLCWLWLFVLPGCQRKETSNCRNQEEEVESLSSQTERQKTPRIPEEEIWNLRQGKAEKSCGGRYSSCSCSTFSFKSPYNQVEEKAQHLELLPAGWRTPLTSFFSFWTAKEKWKWGCIAYFLVINVVTNCYSTLIYHCWTTTSCWIKTAWYLWLLQSRLCGQRLRGIFLVIWCIIIVLFNAQCSIPRCVSLN